MSGSWLGRTGAGVERSLDGGATWHLFNRGLYARGAWL